ncbi:UNVERIFIED_CONTAM: Dirigent protein 10 [Sesamum latifolium]|uniref:Dirigent protein 10 n=1 Tax=Sesamum latifolium TaxID=2727402 RepID=A0AAW2XUT7_9LAMI
MRRQTPPPAVVPGATTTTTTPGGAPITPANPGGAAATTPVNPGGAATVVTSPDDHSLTFFMHDILGGSRPSAIAVTGIVANPAIGGQVPFAKPNGAVLPVNNGIPTNNANGGIVNNTNIPFLTGLSGFIEHRPKQQREQHHRRDARIPRPR